MDYVEALLRSLNIPVVNAEEVKRQVEKILRGLQLI